MMAVVEEIIRIEPDNSISFGNYLSKTKLKADGFEFNGDLYKVKTHNEILRLEKNGKLLFESVPGAVAHYFKMDEESVSFKIEGFEDTQITIELEPEIEYKILIDDINVGSMKSNLSGKISFSVGLNNNMQDVRIKKV